MKFVCGKCSAKYQIADERVMGRTLRMRCRRCDEPIIIRGQTSAGGKMPPPPPIGRASRPTLEPRLSEPPLSVPPKAFPRILGLATLGAGLFLSGIVIGMQIAPQTAPAHSPSARALGEREEERAVEEPAMLLEQDSVEEASAVAARADTAEPVEAESPESAAMPGNALAQRPARTASVTQRKRSASAVAARASTLSVEEQAMLARMGGGIPHAPAPLAATSARGASGGGSGVGLGAAELRQVVTKGQPQLQRCYETALRGLAADDTIRLDVDVTVGTSGKVTHVATRGRNFGDMATCIERTVKLWRFPTATATTETSFPLVFQPGA